MNASGLEESMKYACIDSFQFNSIYFILQQNMSTKLIVTKDYRLHDHYKYKISINNSKIKMDMHIMDEQK